MAFFTPSVPLNQSPTALLQCDRRVSVHISRVINRGKHPWLSISFHSHDIVAVKIVLGMNSYKNTSIVVGFLTGFSKSDVHEEEERDTASSNGIEKQGFWCIYTTPSVSYLISLGFG